MSQVKGSAITSRVRFIRERGSEAMLKEIRAGLSPENRVLEKGMLPHLWAPFSLFVELSTAIDRALGNGDLELCREMGRYSAKVNLPTLYRIFFRLGSMPFILRKAARLWEVHYDSGRLEVDTDEVGVARLTIADFDTPHRVHCLAVLGWAEAAGELTGAQVIESRELTCRARGDKSCDLFLRWKT